MEYGKFDTKLWRIYHFKSQSYLTGIYDYTFKSLSLQFDEWLINNPTAMRKDYRLQRVIVVIKDDLENMPHMKAYAY